MKIMTAALFYKLVLSKNIRLRTIVHDQIMYLYSGCDNYGNHLDRSIKHYDTRVTRVKMIIVVSVLLFYLAFSMLRYVITDNFA